MGHVYAANPVVQPFKDGIYQPLKRARPVVDSERHKQEFIDAYVCDEGRYLYGMLRYWYLVKPLRNFEYQVKGYAVEIVDCDVEVLQ